MIGRAPTEDEQEMFDWGRNAAKNETAACNDVLKQLLTLCTALLGGSVAFFNQLALPTWAKATGVGFLILALWAAIYGSMPRRLRMRLDYLEDLRDARAGLARSKYQWLLTAWVLLTIALVAFLAGSLFGP